MPWNPPSENQILWLDATVSDSLTISNGSVTQWRDRSAAGNHANYVSGNAPALGSIGSLPAVAFNGSNQYLSIAHQSLFNGGNGLTLFLVIQSAQTTNNTGPIGKWVGGQNAWAYSTKTASSPNKTMFYVQGTNTYASSSVSTTDNAAHLLTGLFAPASRVAHWVDGGDLADVTTGVGGAPTGSASIVSVGCLYGTTGWFDGAIGEILIYAAALTTEQRQIIEGYLAHKWGMAAKLPSNHPYKTVAPDTPKYAIAGTVMNGLTSAGADTVAIYDALTRELILTTTPEAETGEWAAEVYAGEYTVSYFADGCRPVTHGPYPIPPD